MTIFSTNICFALGLTLSNEHLDNIDLKLLFRVKITKKDITMLLRLSYHFSLIK
jgi:hypothetical protein